MANYENCENCSHWVFFWNNKSRVMWCRFKKVDLKKTVYNCDNFDDFYKEKGLKWREQKGF